MGRDVKTGMLIGLVVVTIAVIAVSMWPGHTVQDRLHMNPGRTVPRNTETICLTPPPEPAAAQEPPPQETTHVAPVVPRETVREAIERVVEESRQPPQESPSPRIHIVTRDESLSTIAQTHYGDANKWPIIAEANKNILPDVNRLRPGMRLVIPPQGN